VLQLLDEPQSQLHVPSTAQFHVWVQMLKEVNIGSSGDTHTTSLWPPLEVKISGGAAPSFGHLLRPVAAALSLSPESIEVYKLDVETLEWIALSPSSNKQKSGHGKVENILLPPYLLKEGSLLVVKPKLASGDRRKVDRLEDMFLRFVREKADEEKRLRRAEKILADKESRARGGASTGRRKETDVLLKIGDLDLNFSDDDEKDTGKL